MRFSRFFFLFCLNWLLSSAQPCPFSILLYDFTLHPRSSSPHSCISLVLPCCHARVHLRRWPIFHSFFSILSYCILPFSNPSSLFSCPPSFFCIPLLSPLSCSPPLFMTLTPSPYFTPCALFLHVHFLPSFSFLIFLLSLSSFIFIPCLLVFFLVPFPFPSLLPSVSPPPP
jgi:hypothetical protein